MKKLLLILLLMISLAFTGEAQRMYDVIELKDGNSISCQILRISRSDTLIQFCVPENGQIVVKKLSLECVGKYNWPGQNQARRYMKKYNVSGIQDGEYYWKDCFGGTKLASTLYLADSYKWEMKAGQELIKATNHFYMGTCISIIGASAIFGAGSYKNKHPDDVITPENLTKVGFGICILGGILILESHIHILKAGQIMQNYENKIDITAGPRGIGLAMRF